MIHCGVVGVLVEDFLSAVTMIDDVMNHNAGRFASDTWHGQQATPVSGSGVNWNVRLSLFVPSRPSLATYGEHHRTSENASACGRWWAGGICSGAVRGSARGQRHADRIGRLSRGHLDDRTGPTFNTRGYPMCRF